MESESSFVPEMADISHEYLELWDQHNQTPVSPETWDAVVDLAKKEEDNPTAEKGIYGNVPLNSLLELADKVRSEGDPVRRYELLIEKTPTGELWFDQLDGLRSELSLQTISDKIGLRHWQSGLDLGTGNGSLTHNLETNVDRLVGIDRVALFTQLAQERRVGTEQYATADALNLPFADGSFEFAASLGLLGSFDREQANQYVKEIARVLKPQGSYFEAFLNPPADGGLHSEQRRSLANTKGILADLIVDQVSGRGQKESLGFSELTTIFRDNGLVYSMTMNEDRSAGVLEFKKL